MYIRQSTLTILVAISTFATLVSASEGVLAEPRKLCIPKDDVCHVPGTPCCDGLKCALAHGGKAAVGYCNQSGRLLQDYYQPRLP